MAPSSPDLNPLDYQVWKAMLESYHKLQPKPKTVPRFKDALQSMWSALPEKVIDNAVKDYHKQLQARVCQQ